MVAGAEVDDDPVEVADRARRSGSRRTTTTSTPGAITFARALMLSANAATVRVSRAVGERAVIAAARRNGISSPLTPVPSIALGAEGVTPVELVAAYAPFANGGIAREAAARDAHRSAGRHAALEHARRSAAPAMDPQDAYRDHSDAAGRRELRNRQSRFATWASRAPVAGKTGTTNSGEDVWFVGYTPTLVAGIWFGYDTPRQIACNASGGRLAAPAWAEFYQAGWREPRGSAFTVPRGNGVGRRRSAERRARDASGVRVAHSAVVQAGHASRTESVTCTPVRRRGADRDRFHGTRATPARSVARVDGIGKILEDLPVVVDWLRANRSRSVRSFADRFSDQAQF